MSGKTIFDLKKCIAVMLTVSMLLTLFSGIAAMAARTDTQDYALIAMEEGTGSNVTYTPQQLVMTPGQKVTVFGHTHNQIMMNLLEDSAHNKYIGFCCDDSGSWRSQEYDGATNKVFRWNFIDSSESVADEKHKRATYLSKALNWAYECIFPGYNGTNWGSRQKGYVCPTRGDEVLYYCIVQIYIWGLMDNPADVWLNKTTFEKKEIVYNALKNVKDYWTETTSAGVNKGGWGGWTGFETNVYNIIDVVIDQIENTEIKYKCEYMKSSTAADNGGYQRVAYIITKAEPEKKGKLEIEKFSLDASVSSLNSNDYALGGAVFEIYDENNTLVKTLTTESNGTASAELKVGTYYIVEKTAPKGYKKQDQRYGPYVVSKNAETSAKIGNSPVTGEISLIKSRNDSSMPESIYKLSGAEYTLYYNPGSSDIIEGNSGNYSLKAGSSIAGCFAVNENGGTCTVKSTSFKGSGSGIMSGLPLGYYVAVETKLPDAEGFCWDNEKHSVRLDSQNQTAVISAVNKELSDPVGLRIYKEAAKAEGYPSLSGAIFEISYYDTLAEKKEDLPETATRKWYVKTVENNGRFEARLDSSASFISDSFTLDGKELKSDERYTDKQGRTVIPVGSITVKEIKAAEGYVLESGIVKEGNPGNKVFEDRVAFGTIRADASQAVFSFEASNELIVSNGIIRGNISFTKIDQSSRPMADVEFELSLLDDEGKAIQSAVIKTQNDGSYTSAGDRNIWFGSDEENKDEENDRLCFGRYRLRELKCKANKNHGLSEDIFFTVGREAETVDLGNIINAQNPHIGTREKDKNTGSSFTVISDKATVTDTVDWHYLMAGKSYTIKGIIMEIGTDGSVKPARRADGSLITAHKSFETEKDFVISPYEKEGSVKLDFVFDSSLLAGKSFVIYEYLFEGKSETDITVDQDQLPITDGIVKDHDGNAVKHDNPDDSRQTGYVPQIRTNASFTAGTNSEGSFYDDSKKALIKDTVSYKGLIPGKQYELSGVLYYADGERKGQAVEDPEKPGEILQVRRSFTPEKANGKTDIIFDIEGLDLQGEKIVVGEILYYNETVIAIHSDLEDEDQTVYFPDAHTSAGFLEPEGEKTSQISEKMTVVDRIRFDKLHKGKNYLVTAYLVEKESGKILSTGGRNVSETILFTAEEENEIRDISLEIDGSGLVVGEDGTEFVVFEEIYLQDKDGQKILISEHKDLNDTDQTVKVLPAKVEIPPETPETPVTPETPEKPETPETPDTPEKPEIPDKPEQPDTPKKSDVPKTGDGQMTGLWFVLSAFSAVTFICVRRHKNCIKN